MARVMMVVVLVLSGCRSLVPVTESSCRDGVQNGDETGVDCGGPVCAACAMTEPTCSDGALNQRESDVDCGGSCSACLPGQRCALAEDCSSLVCTNGRCATPAPCMNQLQDGSETDVDCGGPSCARCADGKQCTTFADCVALTCVNSVCAAASSCTDGERNGGESAVDCGGSRCPSCADGANCRANADCASGNCGGSFTCRPAAGSCTDLTLDGAESDVDCGGASCPRCTVGASCQQPSDCLTSICIQGRCAAIPTCADGVRNGDESDVDCGGALCARCGAALRCTQPTDCLEGMCGAGRCLPRATCSDGVRNGDESDVDCGGSRCVRCPVGESCGGPADCFTGLCSANVCVVPAGCSDQVRNGNESDVDCGGPVCSPCAVTHRCNVNSDCASALCNDQFLRTDTSWKVSTSQSPGWNTVAFNDSAWSVAVSEGAHGSGPPWGASPPMPPSTQAQWIWNRDSRVGGDFSTLYFRKTFVAPASPFVLHAAADDNFTAYLDGVAVTSGVIWFTPGVVTLSPTHGATSVLAFSVTNGGGAGGLVADSRVTQPRCAP